MQDYAEVEVMKKILGIYLVFVCLMYASEDIRYIDGVEVSYNCALEENDKKMSIGYWALGCKYKTLAELKVAINEKCKLL